MVQGLELLLALSLGLLRLGRGQPLLVEPPEPVVAVALGTSQQLTCSLACASGTATVRWRGLDTNLGAVWSDPGRSVLWLHGASLADAGTRVCRGSCGSRTFQHSVEVLVYAFPDQLTISPATLEPGRDREVACTAHNVTPWGPDTLSFALLLGDQELEGVQVLGLEEAEEEASLEAEDPLFRVTQRWLLPTLQTPVLEALHCQATMRLPGLALSHRRRLPVLHSHTSLEAPSLTSPETPGPTLLKPLDCTSTLHPNSISMEPPDFISTDSPDSTSTAHPNSISTEPPNSISTAHPKSISTDTPNSISTKPPDSIATAHPNSISTEPANTPSPKATHKQASSHSPSSPRACYPEIHQAPTPAMEKVAGWGLLCQASCGPGVAVHWTLAPGGLAAYDRREVGAQAWLSAQLLTDSSPEGWFQCRLEPGGQVASLYVQGQNVVPSTSSSPEVVQPPAALWMGSVVLGLLLLLALVSYRLWKHCWPAVRDLTHPPASLGLLPVQDSAGWLASPSTQLQGSELLQG